MGSQVDEIVLELTNFGFDMYLYICRSSIMSALCVNYTYLFPPGKRRHVSSWSPGSSSKCGRGWLPRCHKWPQFLALPPEKSFAKNMMTNVEAALSGTIEAIASSMIFLISVTWAFSSSARSRSMRATSWRYYTKYDIVLCNTTSCTL